MINQIRYQLTNWSHPELELCHFLCAFFIVYFRFIKALTTHVHIITHALKSLNTDKSVDKKEDQNQMKKKL